MLMEAVHRLFFPGVSRSRCRSLSFLAKKKRSLSSPSVFYPVKSLCAGGSCDFGIAARTPERRGMRSIAAMVDRQSGFKFWMQACCTSPGTVSIGFFFFRLFLFLFSMTRCIYEIIIPLSTSGFTYENIFFSNVLHSLVDMIDGYLLLLAFLF